MRPVSLRGCGDGEAGAGMSTATTGTYTFTLSNTGCSSLYVWRGPTCFAWAAYLGLTIAAGRMSKAEQREFMETVADVISVTTL